MHYWLHIIHRAGNDTMDYFLHKGYMTGTALFLISLLLVAIVRVSIRRKSLLLMG